MHLAAAGLPPGGICNLLIGREKASPNALARSLQWRRGRRASLRAGSFSSESGFYPPATPAGFFCAPDCARKKARRAAGFVIRAARSVQSA